MPTPVAPTPPTPGLRRALHRLARFLRRMDIPPEPPIAPPMPPGRIVVLPDRGEMFVRLSDPVDGALPVLLLHGWLSSADQNWFRAYEALGSRRQVIAIDHQGHGHGIRSDERFTFDRCADDAAGVLDQLGIDRAIVAGYSMGGPIALHLARRHPDRVAGLVLAATSLMAGDTRAERVKWFFLHQAELIPRFTTGQAFTRRLIRQAIDDDPTLLPNRAWLLNDSKRGYLPDMFRAGRALGAWDGRPWVHEVTAPVTVVITTRDRFVPLRKQREMAELTGAHVVDLDGDHDAYLVRPRQFSGALVDATDDVEARVVGVHA